MENATQKVQQISDHVWIYRHDWNRLEPTIGMILADQGWIAIDGGNSPLHAQRVYEAMQSISEKPVQYVIDTHRHYDHVFGNQAFNAPVIGSKRCQERFFENVHDDWSPTHVMKWLKATILAYTDQLTVDDFPDLKLITPSISFDETMTLHFKNISLHLFPLFGVHTDDGIGVYIPEEKVLFLSDAFYFQGTPEGSALRLPELVEKVATFDVKTYVAGHERPHDRAVFERVRAYITKLFEAVKTQTQNGASWKEVLEAFPFDAKLGKTSFLDASFHRRLIRAAYREISDGHDNSFICKP